MDIEEVAAATPEKILSFSVDPATGYQPYHGRRIAFSLGLQGAQVKQCVKLMGQLYNAFVEKDMEMLEINPLIVSDSGDLKVLDAKVGLTATRFTATRILPNCATRTEEDPRNWKPPSTT